MPGVCQGPLDSREHGSDVAGNCDTNLHDCKLNSDSRRASSSNPDAQFGE
jgi:hypothetical protein